MEESKTTQGAQPGASAPNSRLNHRPTTSTKFEVEEFLKDAEDTERENSTAERDLAVMKAMGRKQLLDRNFGFISMVGFTTTMMATWEAVGFSIYGGLLNGGPVALQYGFILCFFGTLATCCSIAELASIYPTAGGQYHFVALLAPVKWKNLLSWMAGWVSVLAWQATTASCAFLGATATQGLLVLNYDDYDYKRWHGTLMFAAIIFISVLFNTLLARALPIVESCILILHVVGFFSLIIPLVMLGPQSTPEFVFTKFLNQGGWSSDGLSWSVGIISSAYPFICYDGACHMAEEVEDAAITVPRSMITTVILNGALGYGFLIAVLFSMGSVEAALATPTAYPIIEIFYQATQSKSATNAMTGVLIAMAVFATIGVMASCSRLTWAFARDKGLPYSEFLVKLHPRWRIPLNTVALTAVLNIALSLINIGSTAAFNAILSLSVVALYGTYMSPIALMLLLRLRHPQSIKWGPFRMGRWGPAVNVISIFYTVYASIFLLFPPVAETTAVNMNWSSLVCGSTIVFALVAWWSGGTKRYKGPLKEI